MRLILASASPRRKDLLARIEIPFEIETSRVEERDPFEGEDPRAYSLTLASEKAAEVAGRVTAPLVLGADTVVAIDSHILGKPADGGEAAQMLRLLRGRTHEVVTSVVLAGPAGTLSASVGAAVEMRPFADEEMLDYVRTGESLDKAGGYAVQGLGGRLVERVRGCHLTVVGLPLCETARLLEANGVPVGKHDWCAFCPRLRAQIFASTSDTQVSESCPQPRDIEIRQPQPPPDAASE